VTLPTKMIDQLNRHLGETGFRADTFGPSNVVIVELPAAKLAEILDRLDRADEIEANRS
jgi:hypothetical protein